MIYVRVQVYVVLVLSAFFLTAPVDAGVIEVGGGPNVIASPYTYWTNPQQGRFYNPSGIRFGDEFLLFVQGGAYSNISYGPGAECDPGEQVLLFTAPWTWQGVRNHMTYEKVVSPCHPTASKVHYVPGSVLVSEWDGELKLFVDETEGGSNLGNGHFKRTLIGSSSDGRNWTYDSLPLLQQSVVYDPQQARYRMLSVTDVILVQEPGGGDWWGVFNWGETAADFTGRIKVVRNSGAPRGFVVYLRNRAGAWQEVAQDGRFAFVPANVWGGRNTVNNVHFDGTAYTVWAHGNDSSATEGCDDGEEPPGTGSILRYRTISKEGSLGPVQALTSQIRAMPSLNNTGRRFPHRLRSGAVELLYSSSTDRICDNGNLVFGSFRGSEIVLTVIE